MIVVAGPSGGGKSSGLSIKNWKVDWFSTDDHAAMLNGGSYHAISRECRLTAGAELQRFIEEHIRTRHSLAFETTLRDVTFEQIRMAARMGFRVEMYFVAAGPVEEHIRRVANRGIRGGHSASEAALREIYSRAMQHLVTALKENRAGPLEFLMIYDNGQRTVQQGPRLFLQLERGKPSYLAEPIPQWFEDAVRHSPFAAIRGAR